MNEYDIFNGYLTGEEREFEISYLESNNLIDKGFALLEMAMIQEKQMMKDIELKVFKESGTYDDYTYLLTEAKETSDENKKSGFQMILDGLSRLISSIINGITSLFKKKDPNATVELDGETKGMFDWFKKKRGDIEGCVSELESGIENSKNFNVLSFGEKVMSLIKENPVATSAATLTVAAFAEDAQLITKLNKRILKLIKSIKEKHGYKYETDEEGNVKKDEKGNKIRKKDEEGNDVENALGKAIRHIQDFYNKKIKPLYDKIVEKLKSIPDKVNEGVDKMKSKFKKDKNGEENPGAAEQQPTPQGAAEQQPTPQGAAEQQPTPPQGANKVPAQEGEEKNGKSAYAIQDKNILAFMNNGQNNDLYYKVPDSAGKGNAYIQITKSGLPTAVYTYVQNPNDPTKMVLQTTKVDDNTLDSNIKAAMSKTITAIRNAQIPQYTIESNDDFMDIDTEHSIYGYYEEDSEDDMSLGELFSSL